MHFYYNGKPGSLLFLFLIEILILKIFHKIMQNAQTHQSSSFNPDGFMIPNDGYMMANPNPALQSTTAEAAALVAQLIDQLKRANEGTAAAKQQVSFCKIIKVNNKIGREKHPKLL